MKPPCQVWFVGEFAFQPFFNMKIFSRRIQFCRHMFVIVAKMPRHRKYLNLGISKTVPSKSYAPL